MDKKAILRKALLIVLIAILISAAGVGMFFLIRGITGNNVVEKLDEITGFKEAYLVGAEWEEAGTVRVTYRSGRSEVVPITEQMVSGFDSSIPQQITMTIVYKSFAIDVPVTIYPYQVSTLSTEPETCFTTLYQWMSFPAGMYVNAAFPDGTVKRVPVTSGMVRGYDPMLLGEQKITVSYMNAATTFYVQVVEDTVDHVEIASEQPAEYTVGEALRMDEIFLRVVNKSGSARTVKVTEEMLQGSFDSATAGTRTLPVKYDVFFVDYAYIVR